MLASTPTNDLSHADLSLQFSDLSLPLGTCELHKWNIIPVNLRPASTLQVTKQACLVSADPLLRLDEFPQTG